MAIAAVGLKTHIYNNNVKSMLLLAGYPFLLIVMVGLAGMGFKLMAYSQGSFGKSAEDLSMGLLWDAGIQAVADYGHWAILAALVWFAIAFFFHAKMIQMASGSRPLTRKEAPKLYNMLENLCISRGMAMPKLYIIESAGLNAFASGISDSTYAVTVTRGLIDTLEDDEMEAVLGHELTHIINKDVRLLIIGVVFAGMLGFLAQIAFRALVYGPRTHYRSGGNKKGGGAMLIALVVLVIGYIFAIMIRFAMSRRREFLADAGAVELTKNPEAMMRALMRIAGRDYVEETPADVEQMCIENSHFFMGMFATHPPIDDRIETISNMTNTPIPKLEPKKRDETSAGSGGADTPKSREKFDDIPGPWSRLPDND